MRKLILAGMLGCLALAVVGPARAETWYLRQSGETSDRGVAAPLGYCLRGVAVAGGLCAGPNDRPDERDRQQQPAYRRAGKEHWDRRD
jgi:hypothetical protein